MAYVRWGESPWYIYWLIMAEGERDRSAARLQMDHVCGPWVTIDEPQARAMLADHDAIPGPVDDRADVVESIAEWLADLDEEFGPNPGPTDIGSPS